jgi:hypothetical protein
VLLFCATLLVLLGGLEAFLRTTHALGARVSWSEPDERIGFRYTPGATYWYQEENDRPVTGKINRYGWRDSDWSVNKPDGVYRVAVLGDSYVEAFQVEASATFLDLAEARLNLLSNHRFEFMNFGRSGFTQTEQMVVLEDSVLAFSPDMVVLFFLPTNDIGDLHPTTSGDRLRPYFEVTADGQLALNTDFRHTTAFKLRSKLNWFKQNSALLSLIAERIMEYRFRRHMAHGMKRLEESRGGGVIHGYLSLCTDDPATDFKTNYDLNKLIIRKMVELCRRNQISFMLVCIDDAYIPRVVEHYRGVNPSFNPYFFEEDLMAFARSLDVHFLGLQSVFESQYRLTGKPLHFGNWDPTTQRIQTGHWNHDGHRLVADALVTALLSALDLESCDDATSSQEIASIQRPTSATAKVRARYN